MVEQAELAEQVELMEVGVHQVLAEVAEPLELAGRRVHLVLAELAVHLAIKGLPAITEPMVVVELAEVVIY